MSISSINTNLASLLAQSNIGTATQNTSNAVGALSSGNRIVSASTDVAALATGTALQSQVNVLNVALSVASQGGSLLQVADGALTQIQGILQRQQAIATSAQSGSVSTTQRGFLDQEFQALTSEIDQLAGSTNFNGVNLLDGSIAGSTSLSTNTTAGSTTLPPSAKVGTIVTNTAIAGTSFSLTVSGQPTVTLTFGTAANQVKVGATTADTAANLAAALNSSGYSQLSNFRFQASGSDLKAYYTGTAGSTAGIPSITTSSTAANTIVNNTGAASFSAAQSIAAFTGLVGAGDVLTIGTHNFQFTANGTNVSGYNASTVPPSVDIGLPTDTNSDTAVTNLSTLLNSVAGSGAYSDLSGITFSTDLTTPANPKLIATYNGASSTPPTISTSLVAHSGGTLAGSGTAQAVNAAQTVLTAGTFVDFAAGAQGTSLVIDGQTITFDANGTNPSGYASTSNTAGTVDLGTDLTSTLANVAKFLNNPVNNAHLTAGSGATFTSDGTHIYAANSTNTNFAVTSTFSNGIPTGETGRTGAALVQNATANIITLGTNLNVGNTITIDPSGGNHALTLVSGSPVAGQIAIGNNTASTLTNIAAYLNANKASLGYNSNFTFSSDATHVIITNSDSTATSHTDLDIALAASATAPSDVTPVTAATVQAASNVGTFSGTINAGDTIQVGSKYFTFAAAGTAQAVGQTGAVGNPFQINLAAIPSLSDTLGKLVSYLNTSSATPGGVYNPEIANTSFSTNGTSLFAQNTAGSSATTVTTTYTAASAPGFTGVTGANLSSVSASGIGAGITSAVGTPTGSLFVTSTGSASVINHGQAVDLSNISNNAAFVGAFGGTGTIGAITANYVNTGTPATSGIQFSVKAGNDTYTTSTITNAALTSTTAPVTLNFNGSNNVTSALEGGSFTLTLQPQAAVTSQNAASQLATGINASLSSVNAYQNRGVLSYNNNYSATVGGVQTANLAGSSLSFNSADFSAPSITSVKVTAPSTGSTDAKISAVVNGQTFTTISGIGSNFTASSQITLVNSTNPTQAITLTLGSAGSANLTSDSNAAAFQTALTSALGLDKANAGLSFQVGASSADSIGVTLGSATTSTLFSGIKQDVLTQADAATAGTAVTSALNQITALRATVGALEERFNFASSAIQNAVQNQGAAKSNLLDTDVAATSTAFATSQVQLQAGIAVLAQANQLQQNLLKLI